MIARLVEADHEERVRLAAVWLPEHADEFHSASSIFGIVLSGLEGGHEDDEIEDDLELYRHPIPTYPDGWHGPPVWQQGAGLSLRQKRAGMALLAALRGKRPSRRRPEPVATPEQAMVAYRQYGSERAAASALGISKTQLHGLISGERGRSGPG
jgi:hypothetical protein